MSWNLWTTLLFKVVSGWIAKVSKSGMVPRPKRRKAK